MTPSETRKVYFASFRKKKEKKKRKKNLLEKFKKVDSFRKRWMRLYDGIAIP